MRFLAVIVSLLLAGCQTSQGDYTYLASENTASGYRRTSIALSGTSGWVNLPVYYRVFEHQGKVAICGAYALKLYPSCPVVLTRKWFDAATFYVNGTRVGSGEFFERSSPNDTSGPYSSQCVVTGEKWNDSYTVSLLTYRGEYVESMCSRRG